MPCVLASCCFLTGVQVHQLKSSLVSLTASVPESPLLSSSSVSNALSFDDAALGPASQIPQSNNSLSLWIPLFSDHLLDENYCFLLSGPGASEGQKEEVAALCSLLSVAIPAPQPFLPSGRLSFMLRIFRMPNCKRPGVSPCFPPP